MPIEDAIILSGRDAATLLLDHGIRAGHEIRDPFSEGFARDLVDALGQGIEERVRGFVEDAFEGASLTARNLNVEPEHGLTEVVQNADDLGATEVRLAMAKGRHGGPALLVAHDGGRVEAAHVLAMTVAFISTKRGDARATGKFGIGLKTLARLCSAFEVHCRPYSFHVADGLLSFAEPWAAIPGFYEPRRPDTLLVLELRPAFSDVDFNRWFTHFRPDSLLFLRSVRAIQRRQPNGSRTEHRLEELLSEEVTLEFDGDPRTAERTVLRDPATGISFERYAIDEPIPEGKQRAGKATAALSPIAVAYASERLACRFFAGLPLGIPATPPFFVNAQFDTDASRTTLLQDEEWNGWLLSRLAKLAAAGAQHRFATEAPSGWTAVPLQEDFASGADEWLASQLAQFVSVVQADVKRDVRIRTPDGEAPLTAVAFEDEGLVGLLADDDIARLAPDHLALGFALRDPDDRWRPVLLELEAGRRVTVADALGLVDCDGATTRPGEWYVRLIGAAVVAGLERQLSDHCLLLLSNGTRVSAADAKRQRLLLTSGAVADDTLGYRLGLVRPLDPAYSSAEADGIRTWLSHEVGLQPAPSPQDTLRALAAGDHDDPLPLSDDNLLALRDALRSAPDLATRLGPEIGMRVLVDGREWRRGRSVDVSVRPAEAYLPSAMDTARSSWWRAAGHTAGLRWVHPRYAKDLRPGASRARPRRPGPIDLESERAARAAAATSRAGARSLFADLGAETAPRLTPRPTDLTRYGEAASGLAREEMARAQQDALAERAGGVSGLMHDWLSPDLEAVVEDIAKDKVRVGRERAGALIATLNRAWPRLYASRESADAVWAYYSMNRVGKVPATWRAAVAEVPWMSNERGARRAPRDLAVRTPAFEAIFGDAPRLFAHGLDERQVNQPAVRGLGFEAEPHASTLVERLEELREQELDGKPIAAVEVERCYAALAASCPDPHQRNRRRVDDLPISELRRRFGVGVRSKRAGLVRTEGRWVAPATTAVFIGQPIFHQHALFVPEVAERLWTLLDMRRPTMADCFDVLRRVTELGAPDADRPALMDTYRYLRTAVAAAKTPPRGMRKVPLWTSRGWLTDRPVYAVADAGLQASLGKHVPVWEPPVPLDELQPLLGPLGVTVLDETSFTAYGMSSAALAHGRELQVRLRAAVPHLHDWLAIHDVELYKRLPVSWEALAAARVAVNSRLQVEVPIPGRATGVMVDRRAHLSRQLPLVFAFADREALGDGSVMGGLLGFLFAAEERERHVLAHGWTQALKSADAAQEAQGLTLASTEPEPDSDDRRPPSKSDVERKTDGRTTPSDSGGNGVDAPEPEPVITSRRLKRLGEIETHFVVVNDTGGEIEMPTGGGDGLKLVDPDPALPQGRPSDGGTPGRNARSQLASWHDEDRETLGLELLARELHKAWGVELTDVRKQPNVGADAVDDDGRYYELKAHLGAVPDEINLTPSEFERARQQRDRYFLCLVGGLEEGFDAIVKVVPDPLARLPWHPDDDIVISGISSVAAVNAVLD
jgi:hypothetical protein